MEHPRPSDDGSEGRGFPERILWIIAVLGLAVGLIASVLEPVKDNVQQDEPISTVWSGGK
jgi:hypothetical protein